MPDEMLDVVDDEDVVIGQAARPAVHEHGLLHRGVHVFLFSPEGRLLIQKRSASRAQYASLWDCSVSEHVTTGENYLQAAGRGLLEELGSTGVTLRPLVKFKLVYGENDNEISVLFEGRTDLIELHPDPEEIESIQWIKMDELATWMKDRRHEFSRWFVEIMNWYWNEPTEIEVLESSPRQSA